MDSPPINEKVHTKPKEKNFLLSAKNLYLTYLKCPLELKTVIQFLKTKLSSYILQEWVLVREYDEDGEPHLHVYLKTLKKAIIKSATFLDIEYEDFPNSINGSILEKDVLTLLIGVKNHDVLLPTKTKCK